MCKSPSPHFRAFLLPLVASVILLAVMSFPSDADEPRIIREISFVPCQGNPIYLFVFDNGSAAIFDLVLVSEDAKIRSVFISMLDKAKTETTKAELYIKQNCPKPEGART